MCKTSFSREQRAKKCVRRPLKRGLRDREFAKTSLSNFRLFLQRLLSAEEGKLCERVTVHSARKAGPNSELRSPINFWLRGQQDQGPPHTSMRFMGLLISLTSKKFCDLQFEKWRRGFRLIWRHLERWGRRKSRGPRKSPDRICRLFPASCHHGSTANHGRRRGDE